MKKNIAVIATILLLFSQGSWANGHSHDGNITYYPKGFVAYHPEKQVQLRQQAEWKLFKQQHPDWVAIFDERSGSVERAFGSPIPTFGFSPLERALYFIDNVLSPLGIKSENYQLVSVNKGRKADYVIFNEKFDGMPVLWSRLIIHLDPAGQVSMFGARAHKDIAFSTANILSEELIRIKAIESVDDPIQSLSVDPLLKVVSIPEEQNYRYLKVYEVNMKVATDGMPSEFYCLFDATNGDLIYRHDFVEHASDITVNGSVYSLPYDPTFIGGMPHMKIVVGGTTYYTDADGNLSVPSGTSGTFYLQGLYAKSMLDGSSTADNFVSAFVDGDVISWDAHSSLDEVSAYYHTTKQHDYMKTRLPAGFTDMDDAMNVYVNVAGSCNAYYDGNINLYASGGGCNSAARVGDVIYHEYGHGINRDYYNYLGGNFNNGAMNEGYADVWAITHTMNPVLGEGFLGPGDFVRRYDLDPKRYPNHLIGEVHADGEIICGAWWDTHLNMADANADIMMSVFSETMNAILSEADGNEGVLYHNILLEALYADDDNGDLMDGTPWDNEILDGFDRHGITIAWIAELNHEQEHVINASSVYAVEGSLNIPPDWIDISSSKVYYSLNNSGTWAYGFLSELSAGEYIGVIPAQPQGTLISYYFVLQSAVTSDVVTPFKADMTSDPALPFYTLVDFLSSGKEDFDDWHMGSWTVNAASTDGASTGEWEIDVPVPSYTDGSSGTRIQIGEDHTEGSSEGQCAVTGNAALGASAGTNDVDGGNTTIRSPKFDLSTYVNPVFTYWRAFTNDLGSNPGTDVWKVFISNDAGASWTEVENTYTADNQWRKFAFRVKDFILPTTDMYLMFQADDADSNGGARVEAAVDDIMLWDEGDYTAVTEVENSNDVLLYPNPANQDYFLILGLESPTVELSILNGIGQQMLSRTEMVQNGHLRINTEGWSSGIYTVQIRAANKLYSEKLLIP